MQPIGEGAGLLVIGEEGAREADVGKGGARGDYHLGVGVGGQVGAAQAIGAGIAPRAHGSPGSPHPVDQGGMWAELQRNMVKERCWNPAATPCWNPFVL